jgi:hypothetical protein
MMIRVTPKLCASAAAVLLFVSGSAVAQVIAESEGPTTTYKFGGYAKFDAMFTDYSEGTPGGNCGLMRQFYYAPHIPVAGETENPAGCSITPGADVTADFQARETRINFRVDHNTPGGDSVTAFIEMDFFIHGDGNEVVSNSYSPRLRHAFIKYNNWTFGQTWSTFQDVAALPEALDFVGPAESTTFIRQAMVRYTAGGLELAVENPQTFVAGGTRDLSTIPDLIGRYTFKWGDKGSYLKVAGLYRNIKIQDTTGGGSQADESGYGLTASTKWVFGGGADLRAMVTWGDGVGRYVGLGFVPDGYVDTAGNIATAEMVAAFVALRIPFGKWRTNIMYGTTDIEYDNDALAVGLNDTGSSIHVNLIYNILPKLDVGAEVIYGEREEIGGASGDFTRFQFSAKYAF